MKYKCKISAILPTFNRCDLLEQRIYEINNQSYDDWQLIIINDGSTDNTKKMLDSVENKKIKCIHLSKNSGMVSLPRAIGIVNSEGEYISPIDDDVINLPTKFEKLITGIESEENIVLCYGDRLDFDANTLNSNYIKITEWDPLILNGWGIDNGQFIYKSNVYETVPIEFPIRGCDWELAKLIKPLGKFKYINELVSIYIKHSSNRTTGFNNPSSFNIDFYKSYFNTNFKIKY